MKQVRSGPPATMVAGMQREAPLRIFLSHTSELREHPSERSYVAAAEAAVMHAGHAISNIAYFAGRSRGDRWQWAT